MRYLLILYFASWSLLYAQEPYTLATGGKTIEFKDVTNLTILGTAGSQLRIEQGRERTESDSEDDCSCDDDNGNVFFRNTRNDRPQRQDPRADGLRRISASGVIDNTNLGVSVTEEADRILIRRVGSQQRAITVRVPNSAEVKVGGGSLMHDGGVEIRDLRGALDVSSTKTIRLQNVMGPVAANAMYGDIIAVWDRAPTEEVRLHSTYANVDVSLPASAKVDVRFSTSYGEMFTDFNIQVKSNTVPEPEETDRQVRVFPSGGDRNFTFDFRSGGERKQGLTGSINGGGPLLALTATYKNIYLRKQ